MRSWKLIVAAAAVLITLVGGIIVVVMIWPDAETRAAAKAQRNIDSSAPGADEPNAVVAHLASKKFDALSQAKKEAYYRTLAEAPDESFEARRRAWGEAWESLDEEQRNRLQQHVRPIMEMRRDIQLDRYFAMTPEEKTAVLDKMLDRMEGFRRQRQADRSEESSSSGSDSAPRRRRGRGHRGFRPEHLNSFVHNVPPERRAKFVQFMKDMRDRRAERARE